MPTSSHSTVHKKTCQNFGIENLIIRLLYSHNPPLFIHYNIIKIQAHFQILRSWMGYITGWSTLSSNKRIAFNQEPKLLNTRKHRMNGNWEIITFASNYCPKTKCWHLPIKYLIYKEKINLRKHWWVKKASRFWKSQYQIHVLQRLARSSFD